MNNRPNSGPDLQTAAITAIAAASKTPFKTAFMATLGVGMAQVVMLLGFFGGIAALGTITYFIVR